MVFVTGGTGLLGSHLLLELAKKGHQINAIYRDEEKIKTTENIFEYYAPEDKKELWGRLHWFKGDLLDLPALEDAMTGCQEVYHCAGFVSFSRKEFSTLMKVNRTGTANIVNLCLDLKVETLTYVSSTAAIGKFEKKDVYTEDEKWKPGDKVSGYAISKFSAEKEVWRGVAEGLNVCIVNPSIILGPGNWNTTSLKIFKTVKRGLKFYPPGANNFVDVRDVVDAMIHLTENKIYNERFLVAGQHMTYKELFTKMALAFKKKPPHLKAGPFLSKLAWRLNSFWALISGSKPLLTKSSVNASLESVKYSSEKYLTKSQQQFKSPEDTLVNSTQFFNRYYL